MQDENEKLAKIAEKLIIIKQEIEDTLNIINLKVSKNNEHLNIDDSREYFENESKVIEGIFNGEVMIGPDEKEYSIPANYISKSKIVEGDKLKLTIKKDGTFVYKQIEPIERARLTGILTKDETQKGYLVLADGRLYKVQKASVTYFKGEYGDIATILVPKDKNSTWAAIENIAPATEIVEEPKEEPKKEINLSDIKPIKLEDLK